MNDSCLAFLSFALSWLCSFIASLHRQLHIFPKRFSLTRFLIPAGRTCLLRQPKGPWPKQRTASRRKVITTLIQWQERTGAARCDLSARHPKQQAGFGGLLCRQFVACQTPIGLNFYVFTLLRLGARSGQRLSAVQRRPLQFVSGRWEWIADGTSAQ